MLNLGPAIKKTLRRNPELKKLPRDQVIESASTLWDMNKDFAKQPMILGSWIKRTHEMPEAALSMAPQVIGAQEKLLKVRGTKGTVPGALRSMAGGGNLGMDILGM